MTAPVETSSHSEALAKLERGSTGAIVPNATVQPAKATVIAHYQPSLANGTRIASGRFRVLAALREMGRPYSVVKATFREIHGFSVLRAAPTNDYFGSRRNDLAFLDETFEYLFTMHTH
jgi:hypothetical protein